MRFVQNQFFPASDRPEILVDLNLPQNASIGETRKAVDKLEATLKDDPDIVRWSTYVGQGAIRFYLPLDQQLHNPYFGATGDRHQGPRGPRSAQAQAARTLLAQGLRRYRQFRAGAGNRARRSAGRSSTGSAARHRQVRNARASIWPATSDKNPHIGEIIFDWNEPGKSLQHRYRPGQGAPTRRLLAKTWRNLMNSIVNGTTVTQVATTST